MFARLLVLFTVVPVLELYVLVESGRQIGVAATVALVLFTGIAGAALARAQGFELWYRLRQQLAQGQPPTEELLDGAFILLGGLLLLTPGFITDLLGFALLIPPARYWVKRYSRSWLERHVKAGDIRIYRR